MAKDEDNEDFFLKEHHARTMLKFASVRKNDVFCDLGCGDGIAVRLAVSYGHANRAIGVELEYKNYRKSIEGAIDNLDKDQLKKVDLWCGRFESEETYDF